MLSIVKMSLSSSSVSADDSITVALRTSVAVFSKIASAGASALCTGRITVFSLPSGTTTFSTASMYTMLTDAANALAR